MQPAAAWASAIPAHSAIVAKTAVLYLYLLVLKQFIPNQNGINCWIGFSTSMKLSSVLQIIHKLPYRKQYQFMHCIQIQQIHPLH